jgi:hypothetical protein
MDATVFDVFTSTNYTFLEISRGGVYGNVITASETAQGVFKLRDGMVSTGNQESRQSTATLHIRPDESFISDITVDGKVQLVGNGVRVEGVDYEILGATGGKNFDNNVLEHYRLTLQVADYAKFEETS